jgi:hypothetical protein
MIVPGENPPEQSIHKRTLIQGSNYRIHILIMSKRKNIQAIWHRVTLMLIAVLLQQLVYSQLTVSINQHHPCPETELLVPVLVEDFTDVSSFTLFIQYDIDVLEFIDLENPHDLLSGGNLLVNSSGSNGDHYLILTWTRLTPVTIESGKLVDLKCSYTDGFSYFTFRDNSEISIGIEPYDDAVYENGSISPVAIVAQPQHQNATEGEQAEFSITLNNDATFQWQHDIGNGWTDLSDNAFFSGTNSTQLSVQNIPLDFDSKMFRCLVVLNDCQMISDSAVLTVTPLGIDRRLRNNHNLNVYPNPFSDKLHFTVKTPLNNYSVALVNLLGKDVHYAHANEQGSGGAHTLFTNELHPGLYFLQIRTGKQVLYTVKVMKQ